MKHEILFRFQNNEPTTHDLFWLMLRIKFRIKLKINIRVFLRFKKENFNEKTQRTWHSFKLTSYLTGRKRRILIRNIYRDYVHGRCGVPRGKGLSILLFMVYVNDVLRCIFIYYWNINWTNLNWLIYLLFFLILTTLQLHLILF